MYSFSELLKQLRREAGLTQAELANAIGVSPALIAMVESGQRDVSKQLVVKLAKKLHVHPSSISPFIYSSEEEVSLSKVEKKFLSWGIKIQEHLIKDRARLLKDEE